MAKFIKDIFYYGQHYVKNDQAIEAWMSTLGDSVNFCER